MIKEFLDAIQERVADAFSGLSEFAYLGGWYTLGAGILVAAVVAAYFFPFRWVRAGFGFLVLLMGAFLAGMQVMANHARRDNQVYRDKIKKLQAEQKKQNGGGWFS